MTRAEWARELIAKYRKRIETFQELIRELQAEIGESEGAQGPQLSDSNQESSGTSSSIPEVKEWQFLGKTQPEAAKALLKMVGHPLKTEQIMEAIKKGGVEVGGQKFTFYTILSRNPDLVRVRRNTWGLVEWHGMPKRKIPAPRKRSPAKTMEPKRLKTLRVKVKKKRVPDAAQQKVTAGE
jgi:DNA-directed RNA polymerase delta subunit